MSDCCYYAMPNDCLLRRIGIYVSRTFLASATRQSKYDQILNLAAMKENRKLREAFQLSQQTWRISNANLRRNLGVLEPRHG